LEYLPVFRNVKDDQIKAVAKNGGVICINFYSGFLDSNFAKKMDQLEGTEGKRIKDSIGRNMTLQNSMRSGQNIFQKNWNLTGLLFQNWLITLITS
jgi:microsomal dipeptidase-like Zn-dependent dipeptidase